MISIKSLLTYFIINGGLITLSFLHYLILSLKINVLSKILSFFVKNIILLSISNAIIFYNKNNNIKNNTNKNNNNNKNNNYLTYFKNFLYLSIATIIEYYVFNYYNNLSHKPNILHDLFIFIPVSFIFEIIFDFFHYWSHRLLHSHSLLYQYIHKTHHAHVDVTPIDTFVQHPLDLILSNAIPSMLALNITKKIFGIEISLFLLTIMMMYKSYIELLGHSDIDTKKTSSFVQFIWITRLLNISLFSKDHLIHHSHVMYNFSKRFSLWDKLFGTFKSH